MPKIRWKCPHCGKALNVGQKLLGKKVTCPNCKKEFDLPALTPVDAVRAVATPTAVGSENALPTFVQLPLKTDSIFDEEGPASVLDDPKPKPMVPVEPVPPAVELPPAEASVTSGNPFDFFADAVPAVEAVKAIPAKAIAPVATKSKSKSGKSKLEISKSNPFGGSEMEISVPDDSIATVELDALPPMIAAPAINAAGTTTDEFTTSTPLTKPKATFAAKPKIPVITWIFLAWAILASGAAIFFATQKPTTPTATSVQAPVKTTPTPEPDKSKSDKPEKGKMDRNDRSEKNGQKP